jgi:hypothetical protein
MSDTPKTDQNNSKRSLQLQSYSHSLGHATLSQQARRFAQLACAPIMPLDVSGKARFWSYFGGQTPAMLKKSGPGAETGDGKPA